VYIRQAYLVVTIVAAALFLANATRVSAAGYNTTSTAEAASMMSWRPLIALVVVLSAVGLQPFMPFIGNLFALVNTYAAVGMGLAEWYGFNGGSTWASSRNWLTGALFPLLNLSCAGLIEALFYCLPEAEQVTMHTSSLRLLGRLCLAACAPPHIAQAKPLHDFLLPSAREDNSTQTQQVEEQQTTTAGESAASADADPQQPIVVHVPSSHHASRSSLHVACAPSYTCFGGTRAYSKKVAAVPDLQLGLVIAEGIYGFVGSILPSGAPAVGPATSPPLKHAGLPSPFSPAATGSPSSVASAAAAVPGCEPVEIDVHEVMLTCRSVFREYFPVEPLPSVFYSQMMFCEALVQEGYGRELSDMDKANGEWVKVTSLAELRSLARGLMRK
jgi:hypothetical protein